MRVDAFFVDPMEHADESDPADYQTDPEDEQNRFQVEIEKGHLGDAVEATERTRRRKR